MHRIDTPTAQKDKFGAGKNGFTGGNPQTGELPTALDQDFFDSLQEEICGVIEGGGIALAKGDRGQLLKALKAIFPVSSLFGNKLSAAGYQKMPGGVIIQWGTITGGVGQLAGTYPMAFPNGVFQACAVLADKTSGATSGITLYSAAAGSTSKTTLIVQPRGTDGAGTTTARFIAIGW